jgi:hypothetical protein
VYPFFGYYSFSGRFSGASCDRKTAATGMASTYHSLRILFALKGISMEFEKLFNAVIE